MRFCFPKLTFPRNPLKLLLYLLFFTPNPFQSIYIDDPSLISSSHTLHLIGPPSSIPINTIKPIPITPNSQIFIINLNNTYYAIHGHCPYDNTPLSPNLLISDKVFCPSHGSAFSVKSGFTEYGPDIEDLRIYELLHKEDGLLYLKLPKNIQNLQEKSQNSQGKVINYTHVYGKPDFSRVVFIGNDPGVISCIQTLRMSGYLGFIDLIIEKNEDFWDFSSFKNENLRDKAFFEKMKVNMITQRIRFISPTSVVFEDDKILKFNQLVLANGSSQKEERNPSKSRNYNNIFFMKNHKEFAEIIDLNKKSKKILILGNSFQAMNLALYLKHENSNNSIILIEASLMKSKKGQQFSEKMMNNLRNQGVQLFLNKKFKQILNSHEVLFTDGSTETYETLIFQQKTKPNIDLIKDFLTIDPSGGLAVDVFLRTARNNIFAIGSISSLPITDLGFRINISNNINESINQGIYTAYNILQNNEPYCMIPFHRVGYGDNELRVIGHYKDYDDIVQEENDKDFLFLYIKDDNIAGAMASKGRWDDLMIIYEGLRVGGIPLFEGIRKGWIEKLKKDLEIKGKNRCRKEEIVRKNREKREFKSDFGVK